MNEKRQAFYKSRQWENLIKLLRIERVSEDGFVICEHCGKPILKAYDCIAHHVIELTEDNVDDAAVALNPANIKLVHFRCHNEIHKRFGYGNQARIIQQVYLVYGSPCSGKTTWVDSVAEPEDIIMDIDRLWSAVRSGACGQYEKPPELKSNVFAMRDSLLDMIRVRRGKWHNAYVIGGYPLQGERERLADSLNARLVFIDTPKEICLERAKQKNSDWTDFVENWFDRYSPLCLKIFSSGDWIKGNSHRKRFFEIFEKFPKIRKGICMDREQELMKLLFDAGIDAMVTVFQKLVQEIVFLEQQLTELKKYPFISVNPKNPAQQKPTPAAKQYKEMLQQYNNSIKIMIRTLERNKGTETSPLREYLEKMRRKD